MFPDVILAFGAILILLIIVDIFIVAVCMYYKYCRNMVSVANMLCLKNGQMDIMQRLACVSRKFESTVLRSLPRYLKLRNVNSDIYCMNYKLTCTY